MEVLITAGGTEEPIDGVRTISNFSTGKTGSVIADTLADSGFKVTLLTSVRGVKPQNTDINTLKYLSFADINKTLKELLSTGKYKAVIHAAAISDYSVDYLTSGEKRVSPDKNIKIDSSLSLTITLKPNFKIVDRIKSYSPTPLTLIAFKLTKNASEELIIKKVDKLFSSGNIDYVIHNDLSNITNSSHLTTIYDRDKNIINSFSTKKELATGVGLIISM